MIPKVVSSQKAAASKTATTLKTATGAMATKGRTSVTVRKGNPVETDGSSTPYIRKTMRPLHFSVLVKTPIGVQETIDVIRARLPTTVVSEAMDFLSVPRNALLGALRIPVSSFHRKLNAKQALSAEETERVMRLASITRAASDAFGGSGEAATWLNTDNLALAGQSPLSLLDTDAGAQQVRRVLAVVNYGGAL